MAETMSEMRRSSDKPSLEIMYIPMDIISEVFAKLPVKTLLRFRCVCKTWCSLIDSHDFCFMHLKLYKNNRDKTRLLALEDNNFRIRDGNSLREFEYLVNIHGQKIKPSSLVPRKSSKSYQLCGSCNGLMLMFNYPKDEMSLWNPTVRKSLSLPPCPFDRHSSKVLYVFGFAPSNNDYKVVAFQFYDVIRFFETSIAVYSLNDHHWRIKTETNKINVHGWGFNRLQFYNEYVFFQAAAYWIGTYTYGSERYEPNASKYGIYGGSDLVSFDFDVEEFSFIQLPDTTEKINSIGSVFVLGESLALFGCSLQNFCIWVLENDREEDPWKLWCSGEVNFHTHDKFWMAECLKIFYVPNSNTFLLLQWGRLYSCKITSDYLLQELGEPLFRIGYYTTYVESLVLHKDSKGRL